MTIHTFEAIHNFRDCGGYPAGGGRAMRRGLLFRSAHYPQATETDLAALYAGRLVIDRRLATAASPAPRPCSTGWSWP